MIAGRVETSLTSPEEFRGKIVLVLGASKGIGADTARAFGRRGATVVLSSRDIAGLESVARDVRESRGEAVVLPVDLVQDETIDALGRELRTQFGHLDFAFNNAAEGYQPTDLAEVPTQAFDRVFQVTVRGTFLAMKQEVPLMLEHGGGSIVNMSSTAGISAFRGGSPYVAAKHAIMGLTKAAALDYAQRSVRVNVVAPGPIETERMKNLPEAYREQARLAVPMRRLGSGQDVAEAVVWLCSPACRFVTGATLLIDGGRMAGFA